MTIQEALITLVAAIISGVLATIITLMINNYKEELKIKRNLADDIFGYRYQLTNGDNGKEFCKALNRVPIVFSNSENVLEAYDKFYDSLNISNPIERETKSNEAMVSFFKEICKAAKVECSNWNDSKFMKVFEIKTNERVH